MLFGNRPKREPQSDFGKAWNPNNRSILGVLFNPEIGMSMRPLGHAVGLFAQIIAMIFVMNGLLPKNFRTGLNMDPSAQSTLRIRDVMQAAWSHLEFNAEGAPKIALFFAVVLCFVLTIGAGITTVLLLFVGTAHADTTGCGNGFFTPCDPTNDLAQSWLDFIFKNGALAPDMANAAPGIAASHAWQTAFITVLSFYSDAILVVAAFILFYHLTSMVVETAHHGVPMGKRASQIWAPIRLVVAIGLIVPLSSGLNCGQYIVIQIVEWGSGLASNAWALFVGNLVADSAVPPPAPDMRIFAQDIINMAACQYTYNHFQTDSNSPIDTQSQVTKQTPTIKPNNGTKYSYMPQDGAQTKEDLCGAILFPAAPSFTMTDPQGNTVPSDGQTVGSAITTSKSSVIGAQVAPAVTQAMQKAVDAAFDLATTEVTSFLSAAILPPNQNVTPPTTDLVGPVAAILQSTLESGLSGAVSSIASQDATMKSKWTSWGWVSAGAYFNDIAAVQGVLVSIVKAATPTFTAPKIYGMTGGDASNSAGSAQLYGSVNNYLSLFFDAVNVNKMQAQTATPATATDETKQPNAHGVCDRGVADLLAGWQDELVNQGTQPVDMVFELVDHAAAMNCVWNLFDKNNPQSLGIQFTSTNPLAEIASLGHGNISVAMELMNWYVYLQIFSAGGKAVEDLTKRISDSEKSKPALQRIARVLGPISGGIAGLADGIGGLIAFLALIFFICGFTLAFFLPLVPFTKFFFFTLSWMVMVLEAVVAVPLVALAHLNPEGEGLPGASAKGAYFYIFDIFLRPVMMVFGLICSYLVFMAAVVFMNTMYQTAIAGTGGFGHAHLVFTRLIFSMIYVMLLYTAANNSFKLIHFIPDHALRWMGAQSLGKETIGDASDLAGHVGTIINYGGVQALSNVQNSASKLGGGLGKIASGFGGGVSAPPAPAALPPREAGGGHGTASGPVAPAGGSPPPAPGARTPTTPAPPATHPGAYTRGTPPRT